MSQLTPQLTQIIKRLGVRFERKGKARFQNMYCLLIYMSKIGKCELFEKISAIPKYGSDHLYIAHNRSMPGLIPMTWVYFELPRGMDRSVSSLFDHTDFKPVIVVPKDISACLKFFDRIDPECRGLRYLGHMHSISPTLDIWKRGFIHIISQPCQQPAINWLILEACDDSIVQDNRVQVWYNQLEQVKPFTSAILTSSNTVDWMLIQLNGNSASLEEMLENLSDDWNRFGLIINIVPGYDLSRLKPTLFNFLNKVLVHHVWIFCMTAPSIGLLTYSNWRVLMCANLPVYDVDTNEISDVIRSLALHDYIDDQWITNEDDSYTDRRPIQPVPRTCEAIDKWIPRQPMSLSVISIPQSLDVATVRVTSNNINLKKLTDVSEPVVTSIPTYTVTKNSNVTNSTVTKTINLTDAVITKTSSVVNSTVTKTSTVVGRDAIEDSTRRPSTATNAPSRLNSTTTKIPAYAKTTAKRPISSSRSVAPANNVVRHNAPTPPTRPTRRYITEAADKYPVKDTNHNVVNPATTKASINTSIDDTNAPKKSDVVQSPAARIPALYRQDYATESSESEDYYSYWYSKIVPTTSDEDGNLNHSEVNNSSTVADAPILDPEIMDAVNALCERYTQESIQRALAQRRK